MEYSEAIAYIDGETWINKRPCLDRITELLDKLGNPQKELKFVHIAGTNGKGSCAAMTASILKAAGYKTGLLTSPYLLRFNERIRINGAEIEDADLASLVNTIRPLADAMDDHPSGFEMITAAAMVYFRDFGCDVAVLETGLGGRFDATNVITAPECSVIMNIGLDHMAVLGNTVEQIAGEKAGIIKENCPCVLYAQQESVMDVIKKVCSQRHAKLTLTDPDAIVPGFDSRDGQAFTYRGVEYALPLLGKNQLYNAAAALDTVAVLREKGWNISDHAAEAGLYAVEWPARFEIILDDPNFVVDAAHNPQGISTTADNLKKYFSEEKKIILMGVMADKDWQTMADMAMEMGDEFVTVSPQSGRALPWKELAGYFESHGKTVTGCDSVEDGVRLAMSLADENSVVCAVGSIYMAGTVRACFGLGGKNI